jgi:hypothetical protein
LHFRAQGRDFVAIPAEKTGLDLLDRVAFGYLALPLVIFLVGWCQAWVAACGLLALALAARALAGPLPAPRLPAFGPGGWSLLLGVAAAWSALGGAGHLFHANADWPVRDAVLRDLVAGAWPVAYVDGEGVEYLLRAPIGYYLPAALVGKLAGVGVADAALLGWTFAGVVLFFAIAAAGDRRLGALLLLLAVLVLFSGMDLVGVVLTRGVAVLQFLLPTDHIEWWAARFQYSAHSTQLFWVPNHAIPGWIAAALLIRGAANPGFVRLLPLLVGLLPLWSPLTAIGFLPLAAVAFLQLAARRRARECIDPAVVAGAFICTLPVALYVTMGAGTIQSGGTHMAGEPSWLYLANCAQFVLLEGGLLWILLLVARRDPLLLAAGAVLWLLPLAAFGPGNDLAMRASIPALALLALRAREALADGAVPARLRAGILAVLALGVPTAILEINRSILFPAWPPSRDSSLLEVNGGRPATNYMAPAAGFVVSNLLRTPRPLPGGVE